MGQIATTARRRLIRLLLIIAAFMIVGCDGAAPEPADALAGAAGTDADAESGAAWSPLVQSNAGSFLLSYRVAPEPIPLNETFAIEVRLYDGADASRLITDASLTVDGRMPDHRHGMNREPEVIANDDGSFTVDGMLFHMIGFWELHFDVTRGAVTERAQIGVTLE